MRVVKPGDYYTRAEAIVNIKGQIGEKKRRVTACENILQAVAQTRSISEARRQLEATGIAIKNSKSGKMLQYSKEQFSRNCRHLADLNINPVTIPRDWTINASVKCLPSITKLIQPLLSIGTEVPQEQIPNA